LSIAGFLDDCGDGVRFDDDDDDDDFLGVDDRRDGVVDLTGSGSAATTRNRPRISSLSLCPSRKMEEAGRGLATGTGTCIFCFLWERWGRERHREHWEGPQALERSFGSGLRPANGLDEKMGDGGEDKAALTCGLGEMGSPTVFVDGADSDADLDVEKDMLIVV
jgi:hypothetical protein